jgi:hypothetical protein
MSSSFADIWLEWLWVSNCKEEVFVSSKSNLPCNANRSSSFDDIWLVWLWVSDSKADVFVLLYPIYHIMLIVHHRLPIFVKYGFEWAIPKQIFLVLLYPTYPVTLIGHRRLTIFAKYGSEWVFPNRLL